MRLQQTLASSISCSGIGLHSGDMVKMVIHPAMEDTGIIFWRCDVGYMLNDAAIVPATHNNVTATNLGTVIENSYGTKISTIEHLMAAFWGMGIDNAIVEIDAAEVPIMDGSAEPFIFLLESAAIIQQNKPYKILKINKEIMVKDGDAIAKILPFKGFALDISIDFNHPQIKSQNTYFNFTRNGNIFKQMISRARTFGFASDVEKLKKIGLARGGSLDNAIVLDDKKILNAEGLRFDEEFIYHKTLDCIGDYFLTGSQIEGLIITNRPGHSINNKLLHAIFESKNSWEMIENIPTKTLSLQNQTTPAFIFQSSKQSKALQTMS